MKTDPIAPTVLAGLVSGIALALATGACSRTSKPPQAAAIEQMVEGFDLSPKDWLSQGQDGRWKRGHLEWGKPKIDSAPDGKSCTVSVIQLSYLYRTDDLQESFQTRAEALAAAKLEPLLETLSARYQFQAAGWVRVSGDDWHPFAPGTYRHAPTDVDFEAPSDGGAATRTDDAP